MKDDFVKSYFHCLYFYSQQKKFPCYNILFLSSVKLLTISNLIKIYHTDIHFMKLFYKLIKMYHKFVSLLKKTKLFSLGNTENVQTF